MNGDVYFAHYYKRRDVKKFAPLYGVFVKNDDKVMGYVEQSFSMGFDSARVSLVSLSTAKKFYLDLRPKYGKNVFIARLSRRNGPIKIDWEARKLEICGDVEPHKYVGKKTSVEEIIQWLNDGKPEDAPEKASVTDIEEKIRPVNG